MPLQLPPRIPLGSLFLIWLTVGASSFGGGATLLLVLRREFAEKRPWLNPDEILGLWSLCQVVPGINQIAIAILIGQRLRGGIGVCLAITGLLLPGALATVVLTLLYAHVQAGSGAAIVQAALRGIIPASVGVGGLTAYQMLRPHLIRPKRADGRPTKAAPLPFRAGQIQAVLLCLAGAVVLARTHLPVVLILLTAGSIGTATAFVAARTRPDTETAP